MKTGHHIITSPGHPWGWDATLQDYDGDNLIGRGPTELVAIADLIDQLRDQGVPEPCAGRLLCKPEPEPQDRGRTATGVAEVTRLGAER